MNVRGTLGFGASEHDQKPKSLFGPLYVHPELSLSEAEHSQPPIASRPSKFNFKFVGVHLFRHVADLFL